MLWRVELKSGDRGGVVVEGAEGGGSRKVVDVDGVITATRSRDGPGGGYGGDGGQVGGIGEEAG